MNKLSYEELEKQRIQKEKDEEHIYGHKKKFKDNEYELVIYFRNVHKQYTNIYYDDHDLEYQETFCLRKFTDDIVMKTYNVPYWVTSVGVFGSDDLLDYFNLKTTCCGSKVDVIEMSIVKKD